MARRADRRGEHAGDGIGEEASHRQPARVLPVAFGTRLDLPAAVVTMRVISTERPATTAGAKYASRVVSDSVRHQLSRGGLPWK